MNFTKPAIEHYLQQQFTPYLKKHDYLKKNSSDALHYTHQFEGGYQSIVFKVIIHNDTAYIDLNLGIRLNIVEDIANHYTLTLQKYYSKTHTIYTSFGKLTKRPHFTFKINSVPELEDIVDEIMQYLEVAGLSLLDKYSNVQALYELLNNKTDEDAAMYVSNDIYRYMKGLILAKIVNVPHAEFMELVKTYRKELEHQSLRNEMLQPFKKLVSYLSLVSLN